MTRSAFGRRSDARTVTIFVASKRFDPPDVVRLVALAEKTGGRLVDGPVLAVGEYAIEFRFDRSRDASHFAVRCGFREVLIVEAEP